MSACSLHLSLHVVPTICPEACLSTRLYFAQSWHQQMPKTLVTHVQLAGIPAGCSLWMFQAQCTCAVVQSLQLIVQEDFGPHAHVATNIMMQDIVEDFPEYLDAYLRLACIERKQGNLKKAIEWAEKGVDRAEACSKGSSSHTDLLAMAGQLR